MMNRWFRCGFQGSPIGCLCATFCIFASWDERLDQSLWHSAVIPVQWPSHVWVLIWHCTLHNLCLHVSHVCFLELWTDPSLGFCSINYYQLIVWYSMIYHSHSSCPLCLPRHCIWVVANSELCSVCAFVLSIAVDGYGMGYYKPELTCDRKTIRWLFLSMEFHFEIVKLWDCYHRNHRIFNIFMGELRPWFDMFGWVIARFHSGIYWHPVLRCLHEVRERKLGCRIILPLLHTFTCSATLKKGQVCQVRSFPQS